MRAYSRSLAHRANSYEDLVTILETQHLNAIQADALLRKFVTLQRPNLNVQNGGIRVTNAFAFCCGRILHSPDAELRQVVGVFWASVKVKFPELAKMIPLIERRILQLQGQMNDQAVANVLFSASTAGLRPCDEIMQALWTYITNKHKEFGAQAAVNTLQALARMGMRKEFSDAATLFGSLFVGFAEKGEITPPAAASLLSAFASVKISISESMLQALMLVCRNKRDGFDAQAIVSSFLSLSRLGYRDHVEECAGFFSPRLEQLSFSLGQAANILLSLARSEVDPAEPALRHLCSCMLEGLRALSPATEEAAQALTCIAELGRVPPEGPLLAHALRVLAGRLAGMDRHVATEALLNVARLAACEPSVLALEEAQALLHAATEFLRVQGEHITQKKHLIQLADAILLLQYAALTLQAEPGHPPVSLPLSLRPEVSQAVFRELALEGRAMPRETHPQVRTLERDLRQRAEAQGVPPPSLIVNASGCGGAVTADLYLTDSNIALLIAPPASFARNSDRAMPVLRAREALARAAGWQLVVVRESQIAQCPTAEARLALLDSLLASAVTPVLPGAPVHVPEPGRPLLALAHLESDSERDMGLRLGITARRLSSGSIGGSQSLDPSSAMSTSTAAPSSGKGSNPSASARADAVKGSSSRRSTRSRGGSASRGSGPGTPVAESGPGSPFGAPGPSASAGSFLAASFPAQTAPQASQSPYASQAHSYPSPGEWQNAPAGPLPSHPQPHPGLLGGSPGMGNVRFHNPSLSPQGPKPFTQGQAPSPYAQGLYGGGQAQAQAQASALHAQAQAISQAQLAAYMMQAAQAQGLPYGFNPGPYAGYPQASASQLANVLAGGFESGAMGHPHPQAQGLNYNAAAVAAQQAVAQAAALQHAHNLGLDLGGPNLNAALQNPAQVADLISRVAGFSLNPNHQG